MKKEFPINWELLNKKLAYPYEYYFKTLEDYNKNISILTKQDYFSKLKNNYPINGEIERTNKIIQTFNITNGEQLTQLYLKTDVILLADIFEKFITTSFETFKINPLYCVSLPGYTWLCGLKNTNIKLQTLQDKELILLLENNIRGGISSVMGDRYVCSTNGSDDENANLSIDPTEGIWISYVTISIHIDANNLYGLAMSQYLPYDEIKFSEETLESILNTPDDSEIGYFVECDLIYPDVIKEKTKNFPFCPHE